MGGTLIINLFFNVIHYSFGIIDGQSQSYFIVQYNFMLTDIYNSNDRET